MIEALIFDMDGVLVKSEGAISTSFNKVLEKYGVKLNPENKKKYLGRSLRDQLQMMKEEYPQIPKELNIQQFSKEAFQYQLELLKEELVPKILIKEFIKKAKENNIKIAVATSSLRYRAEIFLKLIDIFNELDILLTSEEVSNHKPHPDIFLETAKRLEVLPDNCVVIEDAKNGIDGAQAAKMKTIGVITENRSIEELKHADLIVNSLTELNIEKIKKLF
ncbi:MAG: HAD family phosphatase [Candidatus Pacebacteria bacterium]|nr:HAD family phosphatase [Candidatus Paceibacterota bacterium]